MLNSLLVSPQRIWGIQFYSKTIQFIAVLFILFTISTSVNAQNDHPFIKDTTTVSHTFHKIEYTVENPLITKFKGATSYVFLFRDISSTFTSSVGGVGAIELQGESSIMSFYLDFAPKKSPFCLSLDHSTDRLHPETFTWYNQVGLKTYLSDIKWVDGYFFLLTVGGYYSVAGDQYNIHKPEIDVFWQTNRFPLDSDKNLSLFLEGYTKYRTAKDNYLQLELGLRYIHWQKFTLIVMAKSLNGTMETNLFFGIRYAPTIN